METIQQDIRLIKHTVVKLMLIMFFMALCVLLLIGFFLWQNHVVVIKDGRVYDAFTGSKGMTIDEYKKLWDGIFDINFGF